MNHRFRLILACATLVVELPARSPAAEPEAAKRKPNVIVILADDLGFGDLGVYGGKDIKTPNIDSLARNGVRCTNGYVSCPVCAPTRAGLMTGRYQQRFGLEFNPQASGPASNLGLPLTEITLPQACKKYGYATGMVGKWHLGGNPKMRPPERGFDEFFGFLAGAHTYIAPDDGDMTITKAVAPYLRGIQRGVEPVNEKEYLTDAFTREALAFLDWHKDKPFFLYLPFNAVHTPLQAPAKYMDRVPGIGHPRRKIYAAMLTALDDGVGAILAKLREAKIEEKTLIFFFSDNGGAPQPYNATDNGPLSGKKGDLLEGGIHVPFIVQWKGTLPPGTIYEKPVISLDIFATTLAAAGGELAKDRIYDGVNLIPFLAGKDAGEPHAALFWRYGEYLAVRKGRWKLHKSGTYPAQLYDLTADIGETMDVAAKHPEVVKKLEADLAKWNAQLIKPMWGPMAPHGGNLDWLFEVINDPALRAEVLKEPDESKPKDKKPAAKGGDYWPKGKEWTTLDAEAAGMDAARLQEAAKYAMSHNTKGLLVLRHGKIVLETYADGWGKDKSRIIASSTKSVMSVLVGMALDDGKFKGLDQPIADFVPQWKGTDKALITLRHLLTMTSGLDFRGFSVTPIGVNLFETNIKMPLKVKPGTEWAYNTPGYQLLFHLLELATGEDVGTYAQRKLFGPLGMERHVWSKEKVKDATNYYRLECSTRDLGRLGLFALRGGKWDGKQLVSKGYFSKATSASQELNPSYGFLWWVNGKESLRPGATVKKTGDLFPGAPRDTFAALGAGNQDVFVVPSLDLVVVRQGEAPKLNDFAPTLLRRVIESIKAKPGR